MAIVAYDFRARYVWSSMLERAPHPSPVWIEAVDKQPGSDSDILRLSSVDCESASHCAGMIFSLWSNTIPVIAQDTMVFITKAWARKHSNERGNADSISWASLHRADKKLDMFLPDPRPGCGFFLL